MHRRTTTASRILAVAIMALVGFLVAPSGPAQAAGGGGGGQDPCILNPTTCVVSSGAQGNVTVVPQAPPVRSLTLSSNAFNYATCKDVTGASTLDGLHVPSGSCLSDGPSPGPSQDRSGPDTVVFTNGAVTSNVTVSSSDMLRADDTTAWTMCDAFGNSDVRGNPAPGCTGGAATGTPGNFGFGTLPGADEASLIGVPSNATGIVASLSLGAIGRTAVCWDLDNRNCPTVPAGASHAFYFLLTGPTSSADTSTTLHNTITWTAGP